MGALWSVWWVWIAAAVIMAILEVVLPGFILLGFAIGAVVIGVLFLLGVPFTVPTALLLFAILSLVAWLALKSAFTHASSKPVTFDHDIND